MSTKSKPLTEGRVVQLIEAAIARLGSKEPEPAVEPKVFPKQEPAYNTVIPLTHGKEGNFLWMSDVHFKYHDKAAMSVAMQVGADLRPTHTIWGGDIFDGYGISTHPKEPRRAADSLAPEFEVGRPYLKESTKWSKNVDYILGNHEDRIYRHLQEFPSLYGLDCLDFDKLAGIPPGINCHQYLTKLQLGKVMFHHGQTAGMNVARKTWAKFQRSMVVGHSHRPDSHVNVDPISGESHIVLVSGALCDFKLARYVDFPPWVLGFVTGEYWHDRAGAFCFNMQQRFIINGTLRMNGKTYRG